MSGTINTVSATEILPELSRLAWGKLLASLNVHNESLGPAWDGETLPGAAQLAALPADDWVLKYEAIQEKLAKRQRKTGHSQTGVFYTPVVAAAYLTNRSLGQYLTQIEADIHQYMRDGSLPAAQKKLQTVQQLRVIDPACGTGVFLVEALKLLAGFYGKIGREYTELSFNQPARYTACNQLYGIDIDPVSVWISRLRLSQWIGWLDGEMLSPDLDGLQSHLRCGDTLQGQLLEGVSDWDFILGNPPYISEVRRQSERFKGVKVQASVYYQPKMDLCDAFLAWAIQHLRPNGQLVYVLPEYWTQRASSATLRASLWECGHIREFWALQNSRLFKNAPGHHSSFLIWQKADSAQQALFEKYPPPTTLGMVGPGEKPLEASQLQELTFTLDPKSGKLLYGHALEMPLLQRLSALPPLLAKYEIQQGIVIPQGRLKPSERHRLPLPLQASLPEDAGIFLLDASEICRLQLNDEERRLLKPYYQPAGFQSFSGFGSRPPDFEIIYSDLQNRKAIEQQPVIFQNLRAHLERFKSVITSDFAPYGLHRARQSAWFEDGRKILCPRQVVVPAFAVTSVPAYVNEGFYSIRPATQEPHFVCAILNSRLAWFWFYKQKRKGHRLQIDKEVLAVFPQPLSVTVEQCRQLTELARSLSNHETPVAQQKEQWEWLNRQVYQLYGISPEEAAWIDDLQATILKPQ